jgi:phosphatidylinositol glycan class V
MQVDYGLLHFSSTLKLAGILVNAACFVLAARTLYDLSRRVLRDEYLAYKAALYFCLNPASIFFRFGVTVFPRRLLPIFAIRVHP